MAYEEHMTKALSSIVAAGEAGRNGPGGMLDPLDLAVTGMTLAADELERRSSLGPQKGAQLQRGLRAIRAAQDRATQVANRSGSQDDGGAVVLQRLGLLGSQTGRASAAANRMAGQQARTPGILPTGAIKPAGSSAAAAVKPFAHLLVMQPMKPGGRTFYFNLDTAAFDELSRKTAYRWQGQERLSRDIAQQGIGQGEDRLTIKGAIFPTFKGGIGQLDALRGIARELKPMMLTTGYGSVLGSWCLISVDEEQSSLLAGGIPRKQTFSLEFVKYGVDMQNV
ncbi:phage tail protein [Pseudomonas parafulva]|uniref:Phage tail protein n=1 Tax=Pseudomonas parafulva TaxID=157782 RepID=A0AAI8KC41_9PSED|nr:phage tail protein [Pseudomonas parafulva]AXO88987.1 phage tail protein [Pseudomonas parafulva]